MGKLKITPADFAALQAAVAAIPWHTSRAEEWQRLRTAGHSAMRFRFDVLYVAGKCGVNVNALYKYLNDDNIDAAMRAIMPEIKD